MTFWRVFLVALAAVVAWKVVAFMVSIPARIRAAKDAEADIVEIYARRRASGNATGIEAVERALLKEDPTGKALARVRRKSEVRGTALDTISRDDRAMEKRRT